MRITLFTLLGLFLLANVVGALLPARTVVERELAAPGASEERLFELVGDLARWSEWAPAFQQSDGYELQVEFDGPTAGEGGSATLVFDGRFAVLLLVAESDPARGVTVEARSGTVEDDLRAGAGFRSWDAITWERDPDGGLALSWTRTGDELELYLYRLWDRFVVRPSVGAQLERGLERLVEAAANETGTRRP